jgi:hypothetical protein
MGGQWSTSDTAEDDRDKDVVDQIFTAGLVLRSATTLIMNRRQIMSYELWPSCAVPRPLGSGIRPRR